MRPTPVTSALLFTMMLALVSLTLRGWLLTTLDSSNDVLLMAVIGFETLVLGVLLGVVALLALRPHRATYRWLEGLYVFAIVDASLWLAGGIVLLIALAMDGGSMGGHGTADGLATALLVLITAPRMAWSVIKLVMLVTLYRAVRKHAPPWIEAAARDAAATV